MEKFDQKLHRPAGHTAAIGDGSGLYVLYTKNGELELWQAGDRVSDITGYIIPGAYPIRRIGTFIPDEPDIAAKKRTFRRKLVNATCKRKIGENYVER